VPTSRRGAEGEAEQDDVRLLENLSTGLSQFPDKEPQTCVPHVVKLLVSRGLRYGVKLVGYVLPREESVNQTGLAPRLVPQ